jgi:hypothetical protein
MSSLIEVMSSLLALTGFARVRQPSPGDAAKAAAAQAVLVAASKPRATRRTSAN